MKAPEQRAECVREVALDLCRHPGLGITGGACGDCLRRVDAVFLAGHAAALESVDLTRVQKWAIVRSVSPQEAAMLPHDDPNYRVFRSGSQP